MDFGFIFMFLGISMLSSMSCKNSAIEMIKREGGYSPHYPKRYYIAPAKWARSLFKIKYCFIPRYLYFELILSLFFAVLGPMNLIICAIVDCAPDIVGILVIIQICLIICNEVCFLIAALLFRRKKQ